MRMDLFASRTRNLTDMPQRTVGQHSCRSCALHALPGRPGRGVLVTHARRPQSTGKVEYGKDWYKQTRQNARRFNTVKEELEYYRKANWEANKGRERKDLYTENWDGDRYKGSSFNILTVIALVSVLVPLLGLVFAWQTFGVLWG